MELPINTLVIVAMVMIVLLAVAVLFISIWGGGTSAFALNSAKNSACSKLQTFDCDAGFLSSIHFNVDVTGDLKVDASDTLLAYCQNIACKDITTGTVTDCCIVTVCQCTKKIPEYGPPVRTTAAGGTPVTTTAAGTATTTTPAATTATTVTPTPACSTKTTESTCISPCTWNAATSKCS